MRACSKDDDPIDGNEPESCGSPPGTSKGGMIDNKNVRARPDCGASPNGSLSDQLSYHSGQATLCDKIFGNLEFRTRTRGETCTEYR
jgi:hypothetical protein